jgi:hypothetical protein
VYLGPSCQAARSTSHGPDDEVGWCGFISHLHVKSSVRSGKFHTSVNRQGSSLRKWKLCMKVRFLSMELFAGPVVMSEVGSDLFEVGNAFHDNAPELEILQRRAFFTSIPMRRKTNSGSVSCRMLISKCRLRC